MTPGFLLSFGGLVLVMLGFAVAEKIILRSARRHAVRPIGPDGELTAALNRAAAAVKQTEAEIAKIRNIALG